MRLQSQSRKFQIVAGQFYLPYGLRLQDDTAFVRQATGINFTNPDRGVQVIYEDGPWSMQLSATNGTGGGAERDTGKAAELDRRVCPAAIGGSASASTRTTQTSATGGCKTCLRGLRPDPSPGCLRLISSLTTSPPAASATLLPGLAEGNWLFARGHNLKVSYDYFDPDLDVSEDHQVRWSVLWEYHAVSVSCKPGSGRVSTTVFPQDNRLNRDEFFAELHGFF